MVINPYKFSGQWVFDDDDTGLVKEPFVAGIDVMIDKLVSGLNKPSDGFLLIFSGSEFPSYDIKLEWRREDCGGNWYWCEEYSMEGWLCPALFKYFDVAPKEIFAKAKAT